MLLELLMLAKEGHTESESVCEVLNSTKSVPGTANPIIGL
jgi:hypothetical protein